MTTPYALRGGQAAKQRLDIVAGMLAKPTRSLLERAGVRAGQHCLDVGCGGGQVALELARLVRPGGSVVGVDLDGEILEFARQDALVSGATNVSFQQGDARQLEGGPYDVVYARFLLSHLPAPSDIVAGMAELLAPGGLLVLEDIDHWAYAYPPSSAYERYDALYCALVRQRGGDPALGFALPGLLRDHGFDEVGLDVVQPAFLSGEAKRIHCITLASIGPAAVAEGLGTEDEVAALLAEMEAVTVDPRTIVVLPRIVQTWANLP
ncbi:hypothetical protein GCM10012275_37080 [Longimycelium tulufanense]|uniref:Methyltransferase domain-containing protein n=1 Tax=Longimycelium tulufanense TaxID=907463 RepID=A0A8J3CGL3_9PSEU|nr:class I SAM-dependent methyltransferase [Longimycelium tulufanense]GGM62988.1 hypothetical protein GCM10012275_37080 [Longimycelium tulufanense]